MSWDASMVVDTGGEYPAEVQDLGNYTWNVSEMFYAAFGADGLRTIEGKSGKDAVPIVRSAIAFMQDNGAAMRALNPKNGWGDYEGAIEFLKTILDGCLRHPKATVSLT
jgi:hypothetical protein